MHKSDNKCEKNDYTRGRYRWDIPYTWCQGVLAIYFNSDQMCMIRDNDIS